MDRLWHPASDHVDMLCPWVDRLPGRIGISPGCKRHGQLVRRLSAAVAFGRPAAYMHGIAVHLSVGGSD